MPVLAALLISCAPGAVAPGEASPPAISATAPPPGSPRSSPPLVARSEPALDAPLPATRLERGFGGLGFQRLTGAHQLSDGRWLVVEQPGRILSWSEGQAQASVFLDIRDRVNSAGNEEGLLGLALAPDFERSGIFFLDYTRDNPRRTVISSFTAAAGGTADPRSEAVILEIVTPPTFEVDGRHSRDRSVSSRPDAATKSS